MKLLMRIFRISETAATMCMVIGCLFAVLLAVGTLAAAFVYPFERPMPYALGLLLGCLLSEVKVVLLEKSIGRSVDMSGGMAGGYAVMMSTLRYLLTVVALLIVFFFRDVFGLFGTVIGILSLQAAAYITGHILKKRDAAK